jgi:hypothetical protein
MLASLEKILLTQSVALRADFRRSPSPEQVGQMVGKVRPAKKGQAQSPARYPDIPEIWSRHVIPYREARHNRRPTNRARKAIKRVVSLRLPANGPHG